MKKFINLLLLTFFVSIMYAQKTPQLTEQQLIDNPDKYENTIVGVLNLWFSSSQQPSGFSLRPQSREAERLNILNNYPRYNNSNIIESCYIREMV